MSPKTPVKIINQTKNTVLAEGAIVANTVFQRMKGLLGKQELKEGQALVLKPCNSIHTIFMGFPIDVLFVDKDNRVIKSISSLNPYRLTRLYFNASFVIELPAGTIQASKTSPGDTLTFL